MNLAKKIYSDERHCWIPFIIGYVNFTVCKYYFHLAFNPLLLLIFMIALCIVFSCISMYVRQEFKEHVTLKDITMYLIACAEMSVYVAIGKYVGVSGISSMRELFIFEICVFPIYLLVAKLMDKGFFTNKAK